MASLKKKKKKGIKRNSGKRQRLKSLCRIFLFISSLLLVHPYFFFPLHFIPLPPSSRKEIKNKSLTGKAINTMSLLVLNGFGKLILFIWRFRKRNARRAFRMEEIFRMSNFSCFECDSFLIKSFQFGFDPSPPPCPPRSEQNNFNVY